MAPPAIGARRAPQSFRADAGPFRVTQNICEGDAGGPPARIPRKPTHAGCGPTVAPERAHTRGPTPRVAPERSQCPDPPTSPNTTLLTLT